MRIKYLTTNLIRGFGSLFAYKLSYPLKPRLMVYEVTRRCNSRCGYCGIWRHPPSDLELSPQEIKTVMRDKWLYSLETVLVTGGEPTVRSDLYELMLAIHEAKPTVKQWFSTNGLLPKYALSVISKLLDNGVGLQGVGISLDGIGEKHDASRGVKGNFDKVMQLITGLKDMGIKPTVGSVLSDSTLTFYNELKEFAETNGLTLLTVPAEKASYYLNSGVRETADKEAALEIVKSMGSSLKNDLWQKYIRGESINFKCFALQSFFVLHYNGEVAPCLKLSHCVAGNIRSQSFGEIWVNHLSRSLRQKTIKHCEGCLNDWACNESFRSLYYPYARIKVRKMMGL